MRVDLHNHTTRCNHATGSMEDYIKRAIELKIDIYGFSDHAPMPFEPEYRMDIKHSNDYENEVLFLKEKYKNDIDIRLAYEVDFMSNKAYMEDRVLNSNVDYLIGSVHFLDTWGFDNPEYLKEYEKQNIDDIWIKYFNTIEDMAKTNYFEVVGHLDLIKVFKYLPKKDIKSIAYNALKQIKKSNMTIEINSAGLRKPIKEQYPSKSLLELAYELDIDITFSSDAHSVEQVGYKYDEVKNIAKQVGYNRCISYINKQKIYHKF
jgi:histidinol-phosphatase (PHP family)